MITSIALVLLIQVALPLAHAAELTRAEYVRSAEPICKENITENGHILNGVQKDVREGKLKLAGGKFQRAARAFNRTIQRLERLPRPSVDEGVLARWFTDLNAETKLLERVADRLLMGSKEGLGRYVLELRHNANVANNVVLTFGFEYCLIQTARFI